MRPRTGLFRRCFHVRLCAANSPPARGVFGQLAHFSAACRGFRLRAAAIAATGNNPPDGPGTIGEDRDGESHDQDKEFDQKPEGQARETSREGKLHGSGVSV